MPILYSLLFVISIALIIRHSFRHSLKPMQLVGAKIKGKIRNVKVLSVNEELKTVTVLDPTSKQKIELTYSNIFIPTSPNEVGGMDD